MRALAQAAAPFLVVLGVAQDGGSPQAGYPQEPGWHDPGMRRHATSLAIIENAGERRWLFDATPDFPDQLNRLDEMTLSGRRPGIDGIFLTHAHIGHYTGLMFLGKEVMGTKGVPVYAMPRMA
ncbi:MAG: MBL fold metallo-hydrolase, partial [Arenimonas sp.]